MAGELAGVFAGLREVLRRHADGMVVVSDTATDYTVSSRAVGPNGKPMWFGAVQARKSAVSYHLMPLYFNPKLQAAIAPELLPRKQGKTCFNFRKVDAGLFAKLDELTGMGREQWEARGFLAPGKISAERMEEAVRAAGTDTEALARRREEVVAKRAAGRKKKGAAATPRRARGK